MDSSKDTQQQDTVVVHGMIMPSDEPSLSPYCLKLETYLKLAKIPYECAKDFVPSSKGKIPWISYKGEEIADSHFCIEFLKKQFGVDLNQGLSTEQKAVSHAFRVMMDEFHFWCNVYFRLYEIDDPVFIKFVPSREYRQMVLDKYAEMMQAQGVGRHSKAEILEFFTGNLHKVQDYLGEKSFLMGETPTDVDCTVYAFLGSLTFYTPQELIRQIGDNYLQNKMPKLYDYFLRMKQLTYPDYKIVSWMPRE